MQISEPNLTWLGTPFKSEQYSTDLELIKLNRNRHNNICSSQPKHTCQDPYGHEMAGIRFVVALDDIKIKELDFQKFHEFFDSD
jgi:hypothetical protein